MYQETKLPVGRPCDGGHQYCGIDIHYPPIPVTTNIINISVILMYDEG